MKNLFRELIFFLFVFFVSYFIYVYPIKVLTKLLLYKSINISTLLLITFLVSLFVIFYLRSKNTFFLLKFFIYEGMGFGFISFWIINLILIINFFTYLDEYILGILSLTLIIIISFFGLVYGRIIFLKNITISSTKIKIEKNFIFISDIHLGTNPISHLNKILIKIKNINYDFILIGGDLIDSSSFDLSNLIILKEINKPIYFVTGNHEYYLNDYDKKLNKLNKYGISTLNDKNISFKELNIIGLKDNQTSKKQFDNYYKLIKENQFNLLLVHKPSIWNDVKNSVDLMLSGHCHNGQIIPFKFFIRFQFKYIYGLYKFKNSKLYISSGAGCWGPRIRVGTSNEIIHFIIKPNIL